MLHLSIVTCAVCDGDIATKKRMGCFSVAFRDSIAADLCDQCWMDVLDWNRRLRCGFELTSPSGRPRKRMVDAVVTGWIARQLDRRARI